MLLEKLCNIAAPSAYESDIREIIKNEVKSYVDEVKVDRMGNIITHKKGNGKRVVVDAHMDEIGFIITGYNEDGTLKFAPLGVIDSKIVPCKVVKIGRKGIYGVIGLKPIHLQSNKEREENINISSLCIDIGASSKKEAKEIVPLGEYASFTTKFESFGEGLIKGKALDDRVGCGVLIEILKENYNCDLYGVFSVQEENENRGAYIPAYNIKPDLVLILEGTICADAPNVEERLKVTKLGEGPAISVMDVSCVFDYNIIEEIKHIAVNNSIPYQIRKSTAGNNDGGAYVMSGSSTKVVTISVPCRYIHSAVSVCSLNDYENTIKLTREYLKSL
ncbi:MULTISPECIES: M42 family metallopeptidase [Clostridium]|uniref:Putative aminopeptidase YsdC n=2 Tax=Clostridium TaxID=1485 RepID=A0A151AI49_9CLOT|nr:MULTISPECIES: M42 family peptidase [Clostridium]KYH27331.1 putative aminopeptidase YsdC [Clostridium colicanis DSM 13634]MBE6043504.1 M42 family peptidase [Clostridium thermopalmarium]PRR74807.1 putative aminopeptidase YsdC [Clostridium thermopalmarium DSM 5974]PVZ15889.1 endoglucanase [Clostridium thermopalmarium DSM 5974]